MAEDETKKPVDVSRRNFLGEVTAAVAGVGLAASCVPFVESMNPSSDILSAATTEVDLNTIDLGKVKTVPWEGNPIFVMHRTGEQIKAMEASLGGFDPEADAKRVKTAMAGGDRDLHASWLCSEQSCRRLALSMPREPVRQ